MIKMRFYIFAIIFAFSNAHPTGERVQNGTPWTKLKHYQSLTGISDEKMMDILRKSPLTKSSDRQGFPKIRVAIAAPLVGTVNPVLYDIIEYNHEMEYHNGVIIILQPGWYTCTMNTRGANQNSASAAIASHVFVENVVKSHTRSYGPTTAIAIYSGYFNQFDLVQAKKQGAPSIGDALEEWFECRMIP